MVEFPVFDDVVGYVRESLGSSAHDYDVAAIAEEISAYDGVKNAMVITAHRGEFWSVVEKHYYYLDSRVPKYDLDDLDWSQYGVPEKMKAAQCAVLKDRGGVADMLVIAEYDYHTHKASLMAPMSEHYLCDYWAHSDVPATFDRLDELFGPGQWEKFLEAFATYHERSSEDGGISIWCIRGILTCSRCLLVRILRISRIRFRCMRISMVGQRALFRLLMISYMGMWRGLSGLAGMRLW